MLSKIPSWLKNKYAITFLFFLLWVLFFDQNDMITQYGYRSELGDLKQDKDFYTQEILKTKTELEELTTNPKTLEKFAREKYFMKKDNEEIFVFTVKK
jgi:cell division protein DivIC